MCTDRLKNRGVSSAKSFRIAALANYSLKFHKRGAKDGSGKADAFFTGNPGDVVWGVIFEIDPAEKALLDRVEGLGRGYRATEITVITPGGKEHRSFLYVAEQSHIDPNLKPYSWYKRSMVECARQLGLPAEYIMQIEAIPTRGTRQISLIRRVARLGAETLTDRM